MNGLSSAISGVGGAIGRYFSVVSFIPSFLLAGFTFALIQSGAWNGDGTPDWVRAGDAFTHLGDLALLVLLSIAIGIAAHPVQFSLVQFFEGYWGTGRLARRLRAARMLKHQRRLSELKLLAGTATNELNHADRNKIALSPARLMELLTERDEGNRRRDDYPSDKDDIMPTRLGNALRRYERLAGFQYGLEPVQVIRHIAFVAPKEHIDYLDDQRELLDLSVRMCATSVCAAVVAIVFLWHHGPWLWIALVPYGIAYLSYRGAVVVAHEYGAAVCAVIDLDRFALYESLRLPRPADTAAERSMNGQLRELLDHRLATVPYEHPGASGGPDRQSRSRLSRWLSILGRQPREPRR